MLLKNHKKAAIAASTFLMLTLILTPLIFGLQTHDIICTGTIISDPIVDVDVNINNIIGQNSLSLGFHTDWHRWKNFVDRPVQQQLAEDACFKLVRVFDFRRTAQWGIPDLMPCTYWDEETQTGNWNWNYVDLLTEKIFSIGAEPLFCLGWAYHYGDIQRFLPSGMAIDPSTGLPYPESYAAYASEWVKHFKQLNLPVRFYEIMNEPYCYFGWNGQNSERLGYYVELWNAAAVAMRQQNPNVLLSNDAIDQKNVLDYWVIHGEHVDYVDFHKYDANTIGEYTDDEMFSRAERIYYETTTGVYGVIDAKQKMLNAWGKEVLAISSETNYNSAWENGSDPKIVQMSGAVWLALVLRTGILKGLDYSVYYEFSSSKASAITKPSEGLGFGLINDDDNQPWYPYYVTKMIGSNLGFGDELIQVDSSSAEVRSIAWIHDEKVNLMIICKSNNNVMININGVSGQANYWKIDNTYSYLTPQVQMGTLDTGNAFLMQGYTVELLQFQ